jgi:hypothetical protein
MKTISLALTTAALAAAAALPTTAVAAPKPSAEILGTVIAAPGGETATVRARYTCYETTHLWVSAKQMNDGERDAALLQEGSSEYADTWLQQHPETLDCDGRNHVQSFTIDKTEFSPWFGGYVGKGSLREGQAFVQFCMTSENAFVYPNRWVEVRQA